MQIILDISLHVFLSKAIWVATSHSDRVMIKTTLAVMDEVIQVRAMVEFIHQNYVTLIGNGGAHRHGCALSP